MNSREISLGREETRELDRTAIEDYEIPGIILMENAGRLSTDAAEQMLAEGAWGARVTVVAGKGNNGGDGFVVARHLHNRGAMVSVCLLGETEAVLAQGSDASVNLNIILKMGITVRELTSSEDVQEALEQAKKAQLVVDAIFGTGLNGEVTGLARELINGMNKLECPILSVDIPSGLDCDSGRVLGTAVCASRTVTFITPKKGFFTEDGPDLVGDLTVADISVPREAVVKAVERNRLAGGA